MKTDPWADVRERNYPRVGLMAKTIHRLLADDDALLAVAKEQWEEAKQEWFQKLASEESYGDAFDEWLAENRPLLAALPDHLKEALDED